MAISTKIKAPHNAIRRKKPGVSAGNRQPRKMKIYKNPHTNEVVETKGGNNKILQEWKAEFGKDTAENDWLVRIEG